jgi:hypothetical protein
LIDVLSGFDIIDSVNNKIKAGKEVVIEHLLVLRINEELHALEV